VKQASGGKKQAGSRHSHGQGSPATESKSPVGAEIKKGLERIQKLNFQDFDGVGVARRVVVTGLAGGATAEV
jgi:hypothetical protein